MPLTFLRIIFHIQSEVVPVPIPFHLTLVTSFLRDLSTALRLEISLLSFSQNWPDFEWMNNFYRKGNFLKNLFFSLLLVVMIWENFPMQPEERQKNCSSSFFISLGGWFRMASVCLQEEGRKKWMMAVAPRVTSTD